MPQAMKISDAKAAVDKEWKKLETIPPWRFGEGQHQRGSWTESRARRTSIKEAQKNNCKVHFASLMDLCHLKTADLEPQFQKSKERVVLR